MSEINGATGNLTTVLDIRKYTKEDPTEVASIDLAKIYGEICNLTNKLLDQTTQILHIDGLFLALYDQIRKLVDTYETKEFNIPHSTRDNVIWVNF